MKVSLNQIRFINDHYNCAPDPASNGIEKLVEKIGVQLGAVDEVIDLGKKYRGITVAKVVKCQKHPDADKLSVCLIDDGGKVKSAKRNNQGYVQVVCGAPNVREGLMVAWLPPGVTVPSTVDKKPFMLEAREIRGETSNGMLASGAELGLNDDHSGILEIDQAAKPGEDFAELYRLDDHIIDIENKMFTHRPDCFGHLGIARELAGIQKHSFTSPKWYQQPLAVTQTGETLPLEVRNEAGDLVKRFMAVVVADVKVGSSPVWLQSQLSRLGVRPINNIVDLTNYFMLETAQPLHAYDYDKVKALSSKDAVLLARCASKGEKGEAVRLLNGKTVQFKDPAVLIATDQQAIGVGGIMGGADTEVDENTKNIIIECANFDLYNIRRTSMHHGLFTEASVRFTKGQSVHQTDRVLAKLVDDILRIGGGRVASEVFDIHKDLPKNHTVKVGAGFINSRLGLDLPAEKMANLLQNVEFGVNRQKDQLEILAPFWRTDIRIPEDIVEEVGRLYGYGELPLKLPQRDIVPAGAESLIEFKSRLRYHLRMAGANEVLTYSFVHGDLLTKTGQNPKQAYHIRNALSPDLQYYRLSLTPSLLAKVHPNIKAGFEEFALFELGAAHVKGLMDGQEPQVPAEEHRLCLVMAASDQRAQQAYAGAPYFQARRFLDFLMRKVNVSYTIEPYAEHAQTEADRQTLKPFEPSRTGIVMVGGEALGVIAEPRVAVRQALKLPKYTSVLEIDIFKLLNKATANSGYKTLQRFPGIYQDLCLRVDADLEFYKFSAFLHEQLEQIAQDHGYIVDIEPVDIFQRPDDTHYKQITMRVKVKHPERTLVTAEVNQLLEDLTKAANKEWRAERV